MTKRLRVSVYTKAAKLLLSEPFVEFSCSAIKQILREEQKERGQSITSCDDDQHVLEYEEIFSPFTYAQHAGAAWLNHHPDFHHLIDDDPVLLEWRLTALCFMAEIVRSQR